MKWRRFLPRHLQDRLELSRHAVDLFVRRVAREVPGDALVLDAGAGECAYRPLFDHCRYIAMDFGLGEPRWDYSRLDVVGDLLRMPLRDDCADAVLTTQTLEHVAEPWTYLKEIARVLKPGGRLYLTAPQGFREHQQPFDYFRFTRFGLRKLLMDAGLDVVEVEPQSGYFWFLADRLQPLHTFFFGKRRHWLVKVVMLPAEGLSSLLVRVVLPLVCYRLDRLDRERVYTTGYNAVAEKGAVSDQHSAVSTTDDGMPPPADC